ncbi:hypothetical protein ACLB2K_038548 [Fragaria x ananassa]
MLSSRTQSKFLYKHYLFYNCSRDFLMLSSIAGASSSEEFLEVENSETIGNVKAKIQGPNSESSTQVSKSQVRACILSLCTTQQGLQAAATVAGVAQTDSGELGYETYWAL